MVRGLMVTSATATMPGSMSDSMRDNSRWIRRDMTKSGFILRHSSSGRNSNPSQVREGVRGRAQRRPRKQLRDQ